MTHNQPQTPAHALSPAQIDQIRSLEVDDIEFDGSTGTLTLNIEAPFSTFSAIVRVLESLGETRNSK